MGAADNQLGPSGSARNSFSESVRRFNAVLNPSTADVFKQFGFSGLCTQCEFRCLIDIVYVSMTVDFGQSFTVDCLEFHRFHPLIDLSPSLSLSPSPLQISTSSFVSD